MRIKDCIQGSDKWHAWRMRPTASNFDKICTPAKGEISASCGGYAAEIVAKELGVYDEPMPTFWMDWGNEHEPDAIKAYEKMTGLETQIVGFVLPDGTDQYGGSPDALVGSDGGLEVKCPKPETLLAWKTAGKLPLKHKAQVQGNLLITGREWWDFFVYHPGLEPFLFRVYPDIKYQANLLTAMTEFLAILRKCRAANAGVMMQVEE